MPPLPPPGGGTSTYCQAKSYQATWFWPGRCGNTSAWSRPRPGRDCSASMVRSASPKFGPRSVWAAAVRGKRDARAQAIRVIAERYVGTPPRASNRKDTPGPTGVRGLCAVAGRSEEHTSELQSLAYLVCRLLLEKKNNPEEARCDLLGKVLVGDRPALRPAGRAHCTLQVEPVDLDNYAVDLVGRVVFFFNDTATTEIYTLSLHDALPI